MNLKPAGSASGAEPHESFYPFTVLDVSRELGYNERMQIPEIPEEGGPVNPVRAEESSDTDLDASRGETAAAAMEKLPLDRRQIEELFSEENLAGLDLNGFVELLRRVPPRFMTHVTRQGVRDNISYGRLWRISPRA